jgi:hypothetical protein
MARDASRSLIAPDLVRGRRLALRFLRREHGLKAYGRMR